MTIPASVAWRTCKVCYSGNGCFNGSGFGGRRSAKRGDCLYIFGIILSVTIAPPGIPSSSRRRSRIRSPPLYGHSITDRRYLQSATCLSTLVCLPDQCKGVCGREFRSSLVGCNVPYLSGGYSTLSLARRVGAASFAAPSIRPLCLRLRTCNEHCISLFFASLFGVLGYASLQVSGMLLMVSMAAY